MKELTKEQTDKLFNTITANGCREMGEDRFHQAVNEAIHISSQGELPVEPACKWILVNGRLPEVDKRVLVYVEDYHIDKDGTDTDRILFGYLRSSGKIKPDGCLGDFNVTKWMPIPKP